MDINQSIEDKGYPSSSHSLSETESSTMSLSISSCNLSEEDEVLSLVNQASDKSINETSPNLLFQIKNDKPDIPSRHSLL